jgi:hypothetical protein
MWRACTRTRESRRPARTRTRESGNSKPFACFVPESAPPNCAGSACKASHVHGCNCAGHLCCEETQQACFCSSECKQAAEGDNGGPSLTLRRILSHVPWTELSEEVANHVRYTLHVLALRQAAEDSQTAAERWKQMCDLHAVPEDSADGCTHERVWSLVKGLAAADVTLEDVSLYLRKEAANSFGILAPIGPEVCCGCLECRL